MTPDDASGAANSLLERTLVALDRLADLGEGVEDEWQYVNDLRAVYRGRLSAVAGELAAADSALLRSPSIAAAIDEAITEASLVSDPHRAIDWLSTFPQVVLLAWGAEA